jgi:LPXTG-motif cell wall-anchored protein
MFESLALQGGDSGASSSTGDIYLPDGLFTFPAYPQSLSGFRVPSVTGSNQNDLILWIGLAVALGLYLKKRGR